MRLSYLLLSIPLFFTVACSSNISPVKEIKSPPIIKKDFSQILDNNFRGFFYFEGNKPYFKRCATEQVFPVNAKDSIRNIYEHLSSEKSEPVYIEFTGEVVFPESQYTDSNVLIRIDRVTHMASAKTSLKCAKPINTFRLKAKGEDPYWRLSVDGQSLFYATEVRSQVYQIEEANFDKKQINYIKSINAQGNRLNLNIEASDCFNLKSNEYWGYTARVDSAGEYMHGCAEPGWPVLEGKFSGYYLNKTADKESNLTLNTDNSVEYNEKTDQQTIIKTGFWKSNSPDRVVVILTQQAGKKIREELIFLRTGLTLSTQQINENNIITNLDNPLLFNKMNRKEGSEKITINHIDRNFTTALIDPKNEVDKEVQDAVSQYFKMHRTNPDNTKYNSVNYDLNGDGIAEAIVLLDWCSTDGCEMLIFKGDKEGYRFSSRISRVHAPITISKSQHFLWQSLLIEKDAQSFKLDFDGISYPIHTRDLKAVNKDDFATGVVLFSQGTPKNWFPIKP